jgi:hypothetical protein
METQGKCWLRVQINVNDQIIENKPILNILATVYLIVK